MARKLDEFEDHMEQREMRKEINKIVKDLSNKLSMDTQMSIGRLKCMAYGRNIPTQMDVATE